MLDAWGMVLTFLLEPSLSPRKRDGPGGHLIEDQPLGIHVLPRLINLPWLFLTRPKVAVDRFITGDRSQSSRLGRINTYSLEPTKLHSYRVTE